MRSNYYLLTSQKEGRAPLHLRIRKSSPYVDMYVNTHVEVNIETWREVMLTPRKLKNYLLGKSHDGEGVEIQKQLEKVKNAVEDLLSRNVFEQEALDAAVADVISAPAREILYHLHQVP